MDYIREELLRQKKALAALISGGMPETEEQPEKKENSVAREDSRELRTAPAQDGGEAARMERGTAEETEGSAGGNVTFDSTARNMAPGSAGGRTALNVHRAAMPGPSLSRSPGTDADMDAESTPGYLVRYGRAVARESADIRAVSRSIQRDARRYDGGFSIY